MDKMYAYIDECGAYGFNFTNSGNSKTFIVVAVLVKETDIQTIESSLETIRRQDFSGHEIKSSGIKGESYTPSAFVE